MERIAMDQDERDKLDMLKRVREGRITQREAAAKLKVTARWVRKLVKRLGAEGDRVVVHGLRGRPSNRKLTEGVRREALAVLAQPEWHDFGPTFASEQLVKRHGMEVNKETLRQWMIEARMWKPRPEKAGAVHPWRERRRYAGELVQWDTSEHDWLEGRGEPVRYLVRLIDDATSWSWGRFVARDATRENMGVLWEYLEQRGRMMDVYTDRDSMFAVPRRARQSAAERVEGDALTQIGRALRELGIGWIGALTPQAKGRVERSFATDQDRLVKLLRLAQVKTREAANRFLEEEYWPEWNTRFAQPLTSVGDAHRPLTPALNLASILSHVETRTIDNDFTISFQGQRYRIARDEIRPAMKRSTLRVELRLEGTLMGRWEGCAVPLLSCRGEPVDQAPAVASKPARPVRKDHNAGGRSQWMRGFFDDPGPPLWQAIRDANAGK